MEKKYPKIEAALQRKEVALLLNLMRNWQTATYDHCMAVAHLTEDMLRYTNKWTEEEKDEIVIGALVHDFGKMFVPFNLTQAPFRLNYEQYKIVQVHSAASYLIVKDIFSDIVENICQYHHEKPNGQGYSAGIRLIEIPEEALFVQIADIYDALTAKRSYKTRFTKEEAIVEMEKEARNFALDDGYLRILKKVLEEEE
jgi:HD-GYP domain-containing protein (c-di-GMP phosphodiesterase class II)